MRNFNTMKEEMNCLPIDRLRITKLKCSGIWSLPNRGLFCLLLYSEYEKQRSLRNNVGHNIAKTVFGFSAISD